MNARWHINESDCELSVLNSLLNTLCATILLLSYDYKIKFKVDFITWLFFSYQELSNNHFILWIIDLVKDFLNYGLFCKIIFLQYQNYLRNDCSLLLLEHVFFYYLVCKGVMDISDIKKKKSTPYYFCNFGQVTQFSYYQMMKTCY